MLETPNSALDSYEPSSDHQQESLKEETKDDKALKVDFKID